MGDFWVFGYGSLIWNPGFEYKAKQKAVIEGFHRSLCIHSWHYRGTKEVAGLVFGLDKGASCEGIAMLVDGKDRKNVIDYLRERELISDVYREAWTEITLSDGSAANALTYVVATENEQYAAGLSTTEIVDIVSKAVGSAGSNKDYVKNTQSALLELGIEDPLLLDVCKQLT